MFGLVTIQSSSNFALFLMTAILLVKIVQIAKLTASFNFWAYQWLPLFSKSYANKQTF